MSKENGKEIDSKVIYKYFRAISQRDFGVVEEMCKSNPGIVNSINFYEDAPLHVAVDRNNLEMIDLLIKNGANVDCLDALNRTPLMLIADYKLWDVARNHEDHKKVLEFLVKNNANVNLVDKMGETALCKATRRGNKEFVKYLCNNGAKVYAEGAFMDPIEIANLKLDDERRMAEAAKAPVGVSPDSGKYDGWKKDVYKYVYSCREIVDILEHAAYRAEHPSVFKQAKQMVVNALGNMSLGNSSKTPSAASSSQAQQKQQGPSRGHDNKGFARE